MAKVAITEQYLEDIADAIREKTGLSDTFYPSEMAPAILTISGSGGIIPTGTISITENGTYNVTQYESADVAVPTGSTINNQNKTVNPSTSQQAVTFDSGYTGLGTVTVNAIQTETKSATPSESAQTITPSSGKYLTSVSVSAIASDYIGSEITQRSSTDLTVSGATVTAPSGYYSASASKSVARGTAGTPTATKGIVSNHSILVTPSVTNTTGYITGSTKIGMAVSVSASELVSGTLSVTSNGTKDVTNYASINVNVSSGSTINNQDKTVSPTESTQYVTADEDYTGLGTVTVNAISSTYIGSGVTRRSSTDLTTNSATVTVPAGYYAEQASKSVAAMTLPTTASSSATSGYTKKATIGRSTSAQYINIGTGYNSAGGYYEISAVANGSASAPTTISGTTATVSTGTNTLTLTKTVSVTPVVSAGYVSSGTATNSSVSLTASVTTKSATTYHPSTTAQSISSGTYLTGAQTIAAVTTSNLSASNIVSGVTIKVGDSSDDDCVASVTGNVVLQNYYTGSSAPSSSTGSNGDLYLQS